MLRLAYGLTGDLGHAEDVAQAAFARAYASWGRVRRTGDPDAYVRRILINENRRRFRRHRVAEDLPGELPEKPAADAPGECDDRAALLAALAALGPRQRDAGPWGACIGEISDDDVACIPSAAPLGTQVLFATMTSPRAVFGTAAGVVSYLRVTRTHGAPFKVHPVAVGRQKFFAFVLASGQSVKHWTAYDAAGAVCASGGPPASHH